MFLCEPTRIALDLDFRFFLMIGCCTRASCGVKTKRTDDVQNGGCVVLYCQGGKTEMWGAHKCSKNRVRAIFCTAVWIRMLPWPSRTERDDLSNYPSYLYMYVGCVAPHLVDVAPRPSLLLFRFCCSLTFSRFLSNRSPCADGVPSNHPHCLNVATTLSHQATAELIFPPPPP